jgi:hypothetical protein
MEHLGSHWTDFDETRYLRLFFRKSVEIILKCIFESLDGDMDWINLAQDRDRWRALENTAMNLRVS